MKRIIQTLLCLLCFLFLSCQNELPFFFYDELQQADAINATEATVKAPEYVTFNGTLLAGGAAPQVLINPLLFTTKDPEARSALPTLTGTYFATATASGKSDVEGIFGTGTNSKKFEISLERGYKWYLSSGLKDVSGRVLLSETIEVDLTNGTPPLTHTFAPAPLQTGTGSVQLTMKVPVSDVNGQYKITKIQAEWADRRGSQTVSITDIDSSGNTVFEVTDVPSGGYNMCFTFYISAGTSYIPVYSLLQSINIFDNLTTNTWVPDHSACISDSGVFELTTITLIFSNRSTFYIGDLQIKNSAGELIGKTCSDSNSGTPYEPLETLQEAINRAVLNAQADTNYSLKNEYIFYICGTVNGITTIPDTLTDGNAASILIKGYQGLDENDNPKDCLNANLSEGETGRPLTIQTEVDVTLQNLKITGGNNPNDFGGGIDIGNDDVDKDFNLLLSNCEVTGNSGKWGGGLSLRDYVKVELEGTNVHDNTSPVSGGGVIISCHENYGLTIKSGTKIDSNTSMYGGGITLEYGKLEIQDGSISGNEALRYGGAIELHESGTLLMSGGTISRNRATGERDDHGDFLSVPNNGNGGGIFIYDIAPDEVTVKITGGEIKQNTAEGPDKQGGAIYFCGGLVNEDYGDGTCMSISGGVHIPYGDSQGNKAKGKNDVYLVCWAPLGYEDYAAVVVVDGPLTSHNASDKIRLESDGIARGDVVVRADGTHITDLTDQLACFDFGDDDWFAYVPSASVDTIAVNSPIFVSGNGNASDTTGDGTRAHPYQTIDKAVKTMNSATMDYFIGIDGSVKGKQTIKKSYGTVEINAGSITLQGVNGLYESGAHIGEPKDELNGNYSDVESGGYTLGIILPCNVTIKNLKITGGKNASVGIDCGGGIYCYNYFDNTTCKLIIDEGTLITGNHSQHGGGIYLRNKANLVMQGGTIKNNTLRTNYSNGSAICCGSNSLITIKDDAKIEGDIYLEGNKLTLGGSLSNHSSTSPVTITVASDTPRGVAVVESATAMTNNDIASFTFNLPTTEWTSYVSADKKQIIINAPIYVAGSDHSSATGAPSASGSGSASSPLNSLSAALALCNNAASQYIIKIDGTINGTNTIAVTTEQAASILIEGVQTTYNSDGSPKNVLNGNRSSTAENGSTIKISSQVPVTLKNIKITGGYSWCGGGIYMGSGSTVILEDKTYVVGNKASKIQTQQNANTPVGDGGGVYNNGGTFIMRGGVINNNTSEYSGGGIWSKGNVYIYGTSVIGDESKKNECADTGDFGNKVYGVGGNSPYNMGQPWSYGGGIYVDGQYTNPKPNVYLGYNENGEETEWTGGIYHNYGRGVQIEGGGEFKMKQGTISGNYKGGVLLNGVTTASISGGLITKNEAAYQGAGIWINNSVLNMTGGIIKENEAIECGDDVYYITNYDYTKIILSGTACIGNTYISYFSQDNNHFAPLYIAGPLTLPEGSTKTATLKIYFDDDDDDDEDYKYGDIVVQGDNYTVTSEDIDKIALDTTDTLLDIFPTDLTSNKYCIDAPIYVAGTDHSSATGAPSDTSGDGSKEHPFASVAGAITRMSDKNTTYTVYIDGTLTEGQVISDVSYYDSTTYKASGINLKGLNGLDGQGRPKDSISCNYNAQNPGIALQVETNPDESYISKLNIYNLRISGGYNTDSQKAAGICSVRNTDVNLYYGTEISNNTGGAWYGYYLYIKGSVYIPSGESGTNDLRFYSDSWSKIKINTILDKHNSEDRIRLTPYPDHYTAGHRIIEKDDNSSPDIDVSKFSVTPNTDEDGNTINWHLKSVYDNYGADLEQD